MCSSTHDCVCMINGTLSLLLLSSISVAFTSPLVRSVEEGAVDEIEFCLTVTEVVQSHIFREYYIDLIPGSATG